MWSGSIGDGSLVPSANKRIAEVDVVDTDGAVRLGIRHPIPPGAVVVELAPRYAADSVIFPVCPICVEAVPDTDEHVGPAALGGGKKTKTCRRCNHVLGSRLDGALIAWCTETFYKVAVRSPIFRGHRYLRNVDVRGTETGQFALIATDPGPRDIRAALESGESFNVTFWPHNLARVRLAGLKNAYLAACLFLGRIPDGDAADAIRSALVTIRESAATAPLPVCRAAETLELARSFLAPEGEHVALATTLGAGSDSAPPCWISFAHVFAASWPLPELPDLPDVHHSGTRKSIIRAQLK
jgi:hypothetical protein